MALRISPDKKRRLRAAGIGGASSARVTVSRPEARAGTSLAPSRGPRLEAAGPAPKRPSFETALAAKRGDARALVTIHAFTKHVAAKKAAAAQTDRLVSAQFGGAEQLAAKGYKTVNPRAGAIIKSLSPTEAAKDAYRAGRKGQVGPAALAALSIFPFGRGPGAAAKAIKAERVASEAEQKVFKATGAARKAAGEQKRLIREERAKRVAQMGPEFQKAGGGQAGARAAMRQLRGSYKQVRFDRLTDITDREMDKLVNAVGRHPDLRPFERANLWTALGRAREGQPLRMFEIKLVEKAFGPDAADQAAQHGRFGRKLARGAMEVANVPRSVMSSVDVSNPLRQSLAAYAYHPGSATRQLGPMFKSLLSEKHYQGTLKGIAEHPMYQEARDAGVQFTDVGNDIAMREEQFPSSLAEKLTGGTHGPVRASSRAYSQYSNARRMWVYGHIVSKAREKGVETPKIRRDAARAANWMTGRGGLGPLERSAPVLNTLMFSPRLFASRIQTFNPQFYASLDPFVRKEALHATGKLLAGGGAVAGAATLAGAKVGTNPTTSDFGKVKVGNTRFDIWGGHQQLARLASQLAAGKLTSSTTGEVYRLKGGKDISRLGILGRFARSKESPATSLVHDMLAGTDYAGKPVSLRKELQSRLLPLLAQDTADIYHGTGSAWQAAAGYGIGAFGVGVQHYASGVTAPKRETDPVKLIKKLGIGNDLPAPVKRSYARLAERTAAWKKATHGKKAGTRDYYVARYKADLALVQKWGYLSADQVAKATDWIGHAPVDDIRKAHAALSKSGGIYDREFSPARETGAWLKAQDSFSSDLDGAVKAGVLTKAQADRGRAWARKASHKDIDKARVALERKLLK